MPGRTAWMLLYAVSQLNSTAAAKSTLVMTAMSELLKIVGYFRGLSSPSVTEISTRRSSPGAALDNVDKRLRLKRLPRTGENLAVECSRRPFHNRRVKPLSPGRTGRPASSARHSPKRRDAPPLPRQVLRCSWQSKVHAWFSLLARFVVPSRTAIEAAERRQCRLTQADAAVVGRNCMVCPHLQWRSGRKQRRQIFQQQVVLEDSARENDSIDPVTIVEEYAFLQFPLFLGLLSSRTYSLGEIHHRLAEINRCKSIKRTELFPDPSVRPSSRNSGGPHENQTI